LGSADRDLVTALRAELAAIEPSRRCDRLAEGRGLGDAIDSREGPLARLALRLRRDRDLAAESAGAAGGAADRTAVDGTAADAADADAGPVAGFDWAGAAEHCRVAWLRGLFLGFGSLSLASARTHLEFVVTPDEAPILAERLAELELPASWRLRRGRGVVTWKSAETVGTFLRLAGAGSSVLELEVRQVARALRGELNRVINAESANLQRAVIAAARQIAAIERLEASGRLAEQGRTVRSVAAARLETPEATLSELAERVALSRSAVQRALDRIEWLDLHDEEGIGRRDGGADEERFGEGFGEGLGEAVVAGLERDRGRSGEHGTESGRAGRRPSGMMRR
jgi:cell division protein WhiA